MARLLRVTSRTLITRIPTRPLYLFLLTATSILSPLDISLRPRCQNLFRKAISSPHCGSWVSRLRRVPKARLRGDIPFGCFSMLMFSLSCSLVFDLLDWICDLSCCSLRIALFTVQLFSPLTPTLTTLFRSNDYIATSIRVQSDDESPKR